MLSQWQSLVSPEEQRVDKEISGGDCNRGVQGHAPKHRLFMARHSVRSTMVAQRGTKNPEVELRFLACRLAFYVVHVHALRIELETRDEAEVHTSSGPQIAPSARVRVDKSIRSAILKGHPDPQGPPGPSLRRPATVVQHMQTQHK